MTEAPSAAPTSGFLGFFRRHGVKLAISALITVSMVGALSKGGLKFIPESQNFVHVRWWSVGAYFAALLAMNYFRAVRWRFLLRSFTDIPRRRILAVSWIGFAAILLLPFRLGEFARPYMIRTNPGPNVGDDGKTPSGRPGSVSMTAATGTIVAERVVDGLFLSIVLAIALLTVPTIQPLPESVVGIPVSVEKVRYGGFATLGLFTVAFIVIAIYYAARDFARRATFAVFGIVSRPLAEKLSGMAEKLADGLSFLGNPRDALPFLGETALYWGFNAFSMWILAWGCGVVHQDGSGINYAEACALMGMLGVAILVPGPPGLLGPFQLGIYAGMTMYFPTSVVVNEGAAYVFLLYVVQFICTLLLAGWFLVTDRGALQQLEEAEGIVPPTDPIAS